MSRNSIRLNIRLAKKLWGEISHSSLRNLVGLIEVHSSWRSSATYRLAVGHFGRLFTKPGTVEVSSAMGMLILPMFHHS